MSYSLLDCGDGRRLERFGGLTVARPAPAALFPAALPQADWRSANLQFTRENGWNGAAPPDWRIRFGPAVLNLRPASGGQLGVFPEHAAVADRLDAILDRLDEPTGGWLALNLFAHTGLATLRLAARPGMAAVAHVDAAPAAIRLARENATASGLSEARIRWLEDDALSFLRRETRRGKTHHIILADPPAYGRSKKGGAWELGKNLPELLNEVKALLDPRRSLFCLTCHSEGWDAGALAGAVADALPAAAMETMPLELRSESGAGPLSLGWAVVAILNS